MSTIVAIGAKSEFLRYLQESLGDLGHTLVMSAPGENARRAVAAQHPEVILLDWMSVDRAAMGQLEQLRAWTEAPVVVLSDDDEVSAMVMAFDHGAYDYMVKPCAIDELAARVRAAQRRRAPRRTRSHVVETASFSVDLGTRSVTKDGREVRLTATEWKLLEVLVRQRGVTVSWRNLLCAAWGPTYANEVHYVRIYLHRLRQKLERDPYRPRHLLTQSRRGYRFEL
ncbi:winged helix-turn-helix domain-containing protein (plasmid) [Rhodococcus opacus]|uniref:winged helix-turn-helix domain-containing protein n=1 Tax=Rhodococcus opacus TaxID=37919 RepID=UPI0034D1CBAA